MIGSGFLLQSSVGLYSIPRELQKLQTYRYLGSSSSSSFFAPIWCNFWFTPLRPNLSDDAVVVQLTFQASAKKNWPCGDGSHADLISYFLPRHAWLIWKK